MTTKVLLFVVACTALALGVNFYRSLSPYQVFTYTDRTDGPIVVLQTSIGLDPYTWYMEKADGKFKAPWCKDYDVPGLNPRAGCYVDKLRYEDRGACWSIARKDLGIWWKRGSDRKVICNKEVAYAIK